MQSDLQQAFNKSSLIYRQQRFKTDTSVLEFSADFLSEILTNTSSSRGLILHPGSNAIFLITVLLSTYNCFISSDISNSDVVKNLNIGDRVTYEKSRGEYLGIDEKDRAIIKQSNFLICKVPPSSYHKIQPYNGNATTLDGRGLRDNSTKKLFLAHLFDRKPNDIPNIIDYSLIIVCKKHDADQLIYKTKLEFRRKRISLSEVFSAAYYTPNDIYHYPGNSAKVEPTLKFTSKVSVARDLIIEDKEKKIISLIVNGRDLIESGISELTSLMARRSLKNITLLSKLEDGDYKLLLNQFPELKVLAWTKEATLAQDAKNVYSPFLDGELGNFNKLIHNLIDKKISLKTMNIDLSSEIYNHIKKGLFNISRNDSANSEIETFVMIGYSLLNLFCQAIFPLKEIERQIELGNIEIVSPSTQLNKIATISNSFIGLVRTEMNIVLNGLMLFYKSIYDSNPKHQFLKEIMKMNYNNYKKAIIVKKEYYGNLFHSTLNEEESNYLYNCRFLTANNFNNEDTFDEIIVSGVFEGKRFGIFSTISSPKLLIAAYPFEEQQFTLLKRQNDKLMHLYNSRNYFKLGLVQEEIDVNSDNSHLAPDFDLKIEDYINNLTISRAISELSIDNTKNHIKIEIIRIATFETGEKVFFSKHYSPYVFDDSTGTVVEADVKTLKSGDILIFTRYSDETKDIVEELLIKLVNAEDASGSLKESYTRSKYWKRVLKDYIEKNNMSLKELSRNMGKLGRGKHETTLKSWLDEDSHIVGPRDLESYYEIAHITGDQEMLKAPNVYCEACREIRSLRMRMLSFIGKSIINSIGTCLEETDELFKDITGDISKLAAILQIDKIVDTKDVYIPGHLANRIQL